MSKSGFIIAALIAGAFTASYLIAPFSNQVHSKKMPNQWASSLWPKVAGTSGPDHGPGGPGAAVVRERNCGRIVSLAPSITEVLYALNLGTNLVGVTRYCDYPPQANQVTKIGGYVKPNYETIAAVNPDLVVLLEDQQDIVTNLQKLNLDLHAVDHHNLAGILHSIQSVGATCQRPQDTRRLINNLKGRMAQVQAVVANRPAPRVLVAIGRRVYDGSVKKVTVVGPGTFYHDLIGLAGGRNAYTGSIAYPKITGEGLMELNPDVIVDLIYNAKIEDVDLNKIRTDWASIANLQAVNSDNLRVLAGEYLVTPGPRFILILENLARAIHPKAKWNVQ